MARATVRLVPVLSAERVDRAFRRARESRDKLLAAEDDGETTCPCG
jgi:hypothetical protein